MPRSLSIRFITFNLPLYPLLLHSIHVLSLFKPLSLLPFKYLLYLPLIILPYFVLLFSEFLLFSLLFLLPPMLQLYLKIRQPYGLSILELLSLLLKLLLSLIYQLFLSLSS